MTTITAVVRNGQLELPRPLDLPDGTEVEVRVPEIKEADEGPMTPEEIAGTLAAMDKVEPFEMSEAERAAVQAELQAQKECEKAHFDAHAEKLRRIWE